MKPFYWLLGICFVLIVLIYASEDFIKGKLFNDHVSLRASGIDPRTITIRQTVEGSADTVTLVKDGRIERSNFHHAGLNIFLVYRRDTLLTTFEQFKRNEISSHKYIFEIRSEMDSTSVSLNIFGPDQSL